jgi:tetratricopeptide (TPR) repeat protein
LDEAVDSCPDEPTGYLKTASSYRWKGLLSLARSRLEEAVTKWPAHPALLLELGQVSGEQGDSATALFCFERVIALTPQTPWAAPYIGAAAQLRHLGELDRAMDCLEQGLAVCERDPDQRTRILTAKALVLVSRRQVAEAADLLSLAILQTKRHEIVREAAEVLAASGEVTEALNLVKGLRPVARDHCSDLFSYNKYIGVLSKAVIFARKVADRTRYEPSAQRLTLQPLSPPNECAIETLRDLDLTCPPPTSLYSNSRGAVLLESDADTHAVTDDATDQASSLFGKTLQHRDVAHFTYVLPNAHIFDSFGDDAQRSLVIYDTDKFVPRLTRFYQPAVMTRVALRDARRAQEPPIELAFVLPSLGGLRNYHHTIVDIFSSLAIYAALELTCPIVTPTAPRGWNWDILRATDVDANLIISGDDVRDRTIRCAICPERVPGALLKEWCRGIVHNVVSRSPSHGPGARLVYVSRVAEPRRSMINEADLEDALARRLGAVIVRMENLSFEAQVRLAHEADVIIGPHGAGLTNIAFARPGSWLVELLPRRHAIDLYRLVAADCGIRYTAITGDVDDLDRMTWHIDVERTVDMVDQIARGMKRSGV